MLEENLKQPGQGQLRKTLSIENSLSIKNQNQNKNTIIFISAFQFF